MPHIVSVPPPHSRAVVDIRLQSIQPDPIPLSICLISMVTRTAKYRADLPHAFSTMRSVINLCPVHVCYRSRSTHISTHYYLVAGLSPTPYSETALILSVLRGVLETCQWKALYICCVSGWFCFLCIGRRVNSYKMPLLNGETLFKREDLR